MLDRTNVRDLDPAAVGEPVDLVTADLSFISLRLVLDPLLAVVRPGGDLVLLVKPQFEAGRQVVSKGRGIVSDPQVWRDVLESVMSAMDDRAATIMGAMASPITGTDGNVEFLLHLRAAGRRHRLRTPVPDRLRLGRRGGGRGRRRPSAPGALTVATVGSAPAPRRVEAVEAARELTTWLVDAGHQVRLPESDAAAGRPGRPTASTRRASPPVSTWP